jgi:site-specific DNA-methyltransferase (adenine-specific)
LRRNETINIVMTEAHNIDCMEAMAQMKDNEFDLAIVDPPYGINAEQGTNRASRRQFSDKQYGWDNKPPTWEFFMELQRVSKNQIIWGANHFITEIPLPNSKHWIVWDKLNPDRCFADCELAWASRMDNARIYNSKRVQELNSQDGSKIHPTQKPTALYKWLLKNYAKKGDRILDTHLGSGSSRIAAYDMGFDFVGYEIDKDYFDAQELRFNNHTQQQSLFKPGEMY